MGQIVYTIGVHHAGIVPVGACRGRASSNGEDVPHRYMASVAEVDDAARHCGGVLIGNLGGGVACAPSASAPHGVAACALGNVAARWRGEEEAHGWTTLTDAVGEGLHGLGMVSLVEVGGMGFVGAEGDDDKVGAFACHTVHHVEVVETACPSPIDAIVGEFDPREVALQGAAQGMGQVVATHMGVAYLHHLDGLALFKLLEHRG